MSSAIYPSEPSGGRDVMLPLAHYAMLVGVVQLLPIPFVDDWIQRRLMRKVVHDVLRRRGRSFSIDDLQPLYSPGTSGVLGAAGSAARALVLKPIRKLARAVLIVFGARRALLEAAQVLLIGHTLDRQLARGCLADTETPDQRQEQARRIAEAVGGAWAGSDRRFLLDLIRRSGRLLARRDGRLEAPPAGTSEPGDEPDVERIEASLPAEQQSRLRAAAAALAGLLRSGEGQSWLARFDAEVDRRLA